MKSHRPIPTLTNDVLERFWEKVIIGEPDECWEWIAGCSSDGYGRFCINGFRYQATRISYALAHGDPGELNINHSCDNPSCVNPDHLWAGTQQEGMTDRDTKRRQARGETQARHILTEKQVKKILKSDESNALLSEKYGVNKSAISKVKRGRTWKHIKGKRVTGVYRTNTTGVRGVSIQGGKYKSQLGLNKRRYYLGLFDTIDEAAHAIIKKRSELV